MAEYRYYLIPDAMTRAFPEQFEKQTPTEFFDNIADLEKRYHQLREMPYNNERTWNERARFPYARLVVGVDRQNPDGAVAIVQVRNGVNYLCDDYRGPYADGSDAQIPQMAKKLVEVIGVDRVRPHTYTQRDGYTWVQVEKDMHITEWLYAHELCSSLQFTRFLNRDGRKLFQVRDGQRVIETNADGTKRIRAVKSIDVTHAYDADKKLIFSIELDGKTYDKREDAGKALLGLVGAAVRATKPVPVGHYAGFEITVEYKPLEKVFHAHLVGEATHTTELGNDAAGNMIRFQNVVSALPQDLNRLHGSLEQLTKQLTNAEEELKQPFLQEQELSDKSARLAELDALLNVGNDAPIIEGEAEELEEEPEDALIQSDDELER